MQDSIGHDMIYIKKSESKYCIVCDWFDPSPCNKSSLSGMSGKSLWNVLLCFMKLCEEEQKDLFRL